MRRTKRLALSTTIVIAILLAMGFSASGATLSGTVYGDGNPFPAGSTYVVVYAFDASKSGSYDATSTGCNAGFYTFGEVAGDGAFKIAALPPSPDANYKYFLKTWSTMPYVDEWFSSDGLGTYDCSQALGFHLPDATTWVNDLTIFLDKGQNITGTVSGNTNDMTDKTYVLALKQVGSSDGCSSPIYSLSALNPLGASSGTYDTDVLPAGNYFLRTYSLSSYLSYYLKSDGTSSTNCSDAGPITVQNAGTEIPNKNFTIATGGGATVGGTVYYGNTSTKATDGKVLINVYKYDTFGAEPCHQGIWVTTAFVNSDGTYKTPILLSGNYLLQSYDTTPSAHVNEWYSSSSANPHYLCSQAEKITVGGSDLGNVDFVLDDKANGSITGTVHKADGTTALNGINIQVYPYWDSAASCKAKDDPNLPVPVTSANEGTFTISNLPNGYYLIKAYDPADTYKTEWYTAGLADPSDPDCSKAQKILVQGNQVTGKTFQLAEATHRTIEGSVTATPSGKASSIYINVYECSSDSGGKCTTMGRWVTSAIVKDGKYKTDEINTAAAPGGYGTQFILQSYSLPQPSYMNEWYTRDGEGSYYWYQADVVTLDSAKTGINFKLNVD